MPWTDDSDPGPWSRPPADAPAVGEDRAHVRARKPDRDTAVPGPWSEPDRPQTRQGAPPVARRRPSDGSRRDRSGPSFQALFQTLKRAVARAIARGRRFRMGGGSALALAGVLLVAWLASGLLRVGPDDVAVITRSGAVVGEAGPGVAYHLPAPFEQARVVSPLQVDGVSDTASTMLTQDDMLVRPNVAVCWRAADPIRYARATDVADQVRTEALGAVRRAIGRFPLEALQGAGLARVQADAASDLQAALDRLGLGVAVVALDLRGVAPASAVATAFADVDAARQSVRSDLVQAAAYRDRAVEAARLEAERTVRAAGTYGEQAAREAGGEAARFAQLDAQYRRYPEVTRQRLYTEMMEHVLRASNKVVVEPGKGAALTLPPELFKPHATPDATSLPPRPAPSGSAAPAS